MTPWAIRARGGGVLALGAIRDVRTGPGGVRVPQVATSTRTTSADAAAVHDRTGALLLPCDIATWLFGDGPGRWRCWQEGIRIMQAQKIWPGARPVSQGERWARIAHPTLLS